MLFYSNTCTVPSSLVVKVFVATIILINILMYIRLWLTYGHGIKIMGILIVLYGLTVIIKMVPTLIMNKSSIVDINSLRVILFNFVYRLTLRIFVFDENLKFVHFSRNVFEKIYFINHNHVAITDS